MFEYVDQTNYTYKVKDVNLATEGRKLLTPDADLAALRSELEAQKPLAGRRITCCQPVDAHGVAFVEALVALGANVRVCANSTTSTVNELAAVLAADEVSTFAWQGESLAEFWWCARKALDFADKATPDVIVDTDGRLSLLIAKGLEFTANFDLYAADYSEADEDTLELVELLRMVRGHLDWNKLRAGLKSTFVQATADVVRQMASAK